ncbi:MAG: VanW family protein [Clostridia bacterium]
MKKIVCAVLMLISLFASSCSIEVARFADGSSIEGIDISYMSLSRAIPLTIKEIAQKIEEMDFYIHVAGRTVVINADALSINDNIAEILSNLMLSKTAQSLSVSLSLNREKSEPIIREMLSEYNIASTEGYAIFDKANGKYKFIEGEAGFMIDTNAVLNEIADCIEERRIVKIEAKNAYVEDRDEVERLREEHACISEFTTYFNKSPLNAKGRVENILKASGLINGYEIKPGENFDINAVLGDRNAKNGWFKAPGIRNSKYEMEYGGGVCQVSSTLYNAALMADLTIVKRTHHSWPVTYVPKGLDATISTGGPNLVLKNETGNTITIAAIANKKEHSLTVRIYGKKPSNFYKIELYSKVIGQINAPDPDVIVDGSLRSGTRIIEIKQRNGLKTVAYKRYLDKSGKCIREERITFDIYRAIGGKVYVSPDMA